MKKTLSILLTAALVSALVFAMVPGVSAQSLFGGNVWVTDDSYDASWYEQKSDGTIAIKGITNNPNNNGLSLAETNYFTDDFTVEMKVKIPADAAGSSCVYLFGASNGFWPTAGLIIKLTNTVTGTGWEIYNYNFASSSVGSTADSTDKGAAVSTTDWNTLKIDVTGTNAKITVNGVVVADSFAFTRVEGQGHFGLGINQNNTDGTEFKDIAVTKGGSVVFTTDPAAASGGSSDTGSGSAGTTSSNPNTADADIIMYAGMTLVLLTAVASTAVVRKRSSVK